MVFAFCATRLLHTYYAVHECWPGTLSSMPGETKHWALSLSKHCPLESCYFMYEMEASLQREEWWFVLTVWGLEWCSACVCPYVPHVITVMTCLVSVKVACSIYVHIDAASRSDRQKASWFFWSFFCLVLKAGNKLWNYLKAPRHHVLWAAWRM